MNALYFTVVTIWFVSEIALVIFKRSKKTNKNKLNKSSLKYLWIESSTKSAFSSLQTIVKQSLYIYCQQIASGFALAMTAIKSFRSGFNYSKSTKQLIPFIY
ncbi:MAG: hypothetical protein IMY72_11105 [Bacteroidetes bacterium]|nr:hypothetical protein [Bacteroidota bacterium]